MSKSKKLKLLEKLLRFMASAVFKKYKPIIFGITGSVGKTSAKEAVFLALSSKFRTRKSEKNYNNEIGIPLTVIGAESGERSLLKWTLVFLKWIMVMVFPRKYPEILILEMGVDRPGDMDYLLSFIPLSAGIVTNISGSHLEFFKNVEGIAKEKSKILSALPEGGTAIINADSDFAEKMMEKAKGRILTYGFGEKCEIRASNIVYNYQDEKPAGLSFKLEYDDKIMPIRLPHVLAKHQVYAALAGIAAGIAMKANLVELASVLEDFCPPRGRMNLVSGIKNSFIIDDTYNSSPTSALAALEILHELEAKRKIAVLGDMLELGPEEEGGHRKVGKKVLEIRADIFFAVGERMENAVKEIQSLGYDPERIHYFENPVLAGRKLQEVIREGDLILVKGSQGMRMEKIMEEVMARPDQVKNLLCRQSDKWRKKAFIKP